MAFPNNSNSSSNSNNNSGDRNSMRFPPPSLDNAYAFGAQSFRSSAVISPPATSAGQSQGQLQDEFSRMSLTRRYTESDNPLALSTEPTLPMLPKARTLEQKLQEIEQLKQRSKQYQSDLQALQEKQKQSEEEIARLVGRSNRGIHPQSEPTTPPEYHESGFPSALSRPNRFSASMINTAPFVGSNRPSRAISQVTSPPAGLAQSQFNFAQSPTSNTHLSWKSVPGSRRNSDDDEEEPPLPPYVGQTVENRPSASKNRNSMPATGLSFRTRNDVPDISSVLSLGHHVNTTRFLFGDDEGDKGLSKKEPQLPGSSNVNSYLQMNATDEQFPILIRRGDKPGQLSASSAALDLASSRSSGGENQSNGGWPSFGRRRSPQKSLPVNTFSPQSQRPMSIEGGMPSISHSSTLSSGSIGESVLMSLSQPIGPEKSLYADKRKSGPPGIQYSTSTTTAATPPKLQSSYSTNDIPTVRNGVKPPTTNAALNSRAEQHLQQHNATLGRIPPKSAGMRQSRDLSSSDSVFPNQDSYDHMSQQATASALQANATPFGPSVSSPETPENTLATPQTSELDRSPPSGQYQGYTIQPNQQNSFGAVNGFQSPQVGNQPTPPYTPQLNGNVGLQMQPVFQVPGSFNGYNMFPYGNAQMGAQTNGQFSNQFPGQYNMNQAYGGAAIMAGQMNRFPPGNAGRMRDGAPSAMMQRRRDDPETHRFANVQLDQCVGQIYTMARDQHGCRYLQRKLEERNPGNLSMIFQEVHEHVVELMTDPFGNYLCQKLLEYSDDEQRTVLIRNAAPQLVRIALNQHGTRALQKMIENLSNQEQIQIVIFALKDRVVEMIQDLNGNHVVQKCLNHLKTEDAQFIFDSVCENIVVIGTHRHGCCVIQRCLDHSTEAQKLQVVETVSANSFSLNEDPFGNYVTQYILDLQDTKFSEPLIARFQGRVVQLSKHKFSSNVIEKCLRVAQPPTKRWMIEEMLQGNELERMTRDQYANYVVQTAMEYADPEVEPLLLERIRAVVPSIRTTPHGRRIAAKVQARDQRHAEDVRLSGTGPSASFQQTSKPPMISATNTASQPNSHAASRQNSQPTSRAASRPVSSHEASHTMIPVSAANPSQGYTSGINGYNTSVFGSSMVETGQVPTSNVPRAGFSQHNSLQTSTANHQNIYAQANTTAGSNNFSYPSYVTQTNASSNLSPEGQQMSGHLPSLESSTHIQLQPAGLNGPTETPEIHSSQSHHIPQGLQGEHLQGQAPNGFTFF